MKYNPITDPIPQQDREFINDTILKIIDSGELPAEIILEDIYNGYTGIGGLHGLKRADYNSYHAYSEDKKEIEQGQFFTPATLIEPIADMLQVQPSDLICDLSCGAGAFINHFNEHQFYGCDIDQRAVKVAKQLYPGATLEIRDVRFYEPGIKFDIIVGNPPFNLRWEVKRETCLSQLYYCIKASELLKPGGILICVVPQSFLHDVFFNRSMIEEIDERFNFLFQYIVDEDAFKALGVTGFPTKVIAFQQRAEAIEHRPYSSTYVTYEEAKAIMATVQQGTKVLKAKLRTEQAKQFAHEHGFEYKLRKYLFEIKTHPRLRPKYADSIALVDQLHNQKKPDNMKWEEWDKVKLTPNKVLGKLRRLIEKQNSKPKDLYRVVQYKYGLKVKAYNKKAQARAIKEVGTVRQWSYNTLVQHPSTLVNLKHRVNPGIIKLVERKRKAYLLQIKPLDEMQRDSKIEAYLNKFGFYNMDNQVSRFNDRQKLDLNLALQKQYSILNWQQGSGKTPAAASWMAYNKQRNTFICGPAVAINMTWEKFMKLHKKDYINIKSFGDVAKIKPGMFVLISLDMLIKTETVEGKVVVSMARLLKQYVKKQSYKVNLVFDESDAITNNASKRTRCMLSVFRKVKRKLLTTGTTTRNNINELYSQLELLYNNSINMICHARWYWVENDEKELRQLPNPIWGEPFPPRTGNTFFKRCFNPEKATVFGIKKHNQDIYNQDALKTLISYTIRTCKFREIAGDKYTVKTLQTDQTPEEEAVYNMIINELNEILPAYFTSTGNSRKDAMLKIIRQLQLLIDATSMPQLFKEYEGDGIPNKAKLIFDYTKEHYNEKVAIGCTTKSAAEWYYQELKKLYPTRAVFKIIGDIPFKKRASMVAEYESIHNAILVCTQQSLSSSVSIPTCNKVIIESKQWNIPKIEQFYFRFIRYTSKEHTDVVFLNYRNTIEMNLMALLLTKEKLNDFIKTLEYREDSDIYGEFDVDLDILDSLLTKEVDEDGKLQISWGKAVAV